VATCSSLDVSPTVATCSSLVVSPTFRAGGGVGGAGGGGGILDIGTSFATRAQVTSQVASSPEGRSPSSLVRLVRAGERDTRGVEEEAAASSRTRSPGVCPGVFPVESSWVPPGVFPGVTGGVVSWSLSTPASSLRLHSSACVPPGNNPGAQGGFTDRDRDNHVQLNARAPPAPLQSESFVRLVRERERGGARGSMGREGGFELMGREGRFELFGRDTSEHGCGKGSAGRLLGEGERGWGEREGEDRENAEMKVCLELEEQLARARAQVRVHHFADICVGCVCVCEGVFVLCHVCFLV
jgi:hypothetical protein